MELPEVEIVCRQMREVLIGKEVLSAWSHPSKRFAPAKKSAGYVIYDIDRIGKYILIQMGKAVHTHTHELICHLGMSGSLKLQKIEPCDDSASSNNKPNNKPPNKLQEELAKKYIRARWFFSDETLMELRDVRRFGYVFWVKAGDYNLIPTLKNAGPDALSSDFTPNALHTALKQSQRNIKAQLLSQKPVTGLGNIYIDEALWRANISPKRRRISQARSVALYDSIRDCLNEGLLHGGTTLRDYRTFSGTRGDHQNHLNCYGRGGKPCLKCDNLLIQEKLDGRGTTYCRHCQK